MHLLLADCGVRHAGSPQHNHRASSFQSCHWVLLGVQSLHLLPGGQAEKDAAPQEAGVGYALGVEVGEVAGAVQKVLKPQVSARTGLPMGLYDV